MLDKNSSAYQKYEEFLGKKLQEALDLLDDNPEKEQVMVTLQIPITRKLADALSKKK